MPGKQKGWFFWNKCQTYCNQFAEHKIATFKGIGQSSLSELFSGDKEQDKAHAIW